MDTSREYIEMCKKAMKIQKIWRRMKKKPKGSIFYNPKIKKILIIPATPYDGDCIWLPRQDDLQGIIIIRRDEYEYYIRRLLDFVLDLPFAIMSMEQLWIAFVMEERYNKTWNGKNWRLL